MRKCTHPEENCGNMALVHGSIYCRSVPCSALGELPAQTNLDWVRSLDKEALKVWYCDGRACGGCRFETAAGCTILAWFAAERSEESRNIPHAHIDSRGNGC